MRVLGIDPSIRNTGYAVLDGEGKELNLVTYGHIPMPAKYDQPACLLKIFETLSEVIETHSPEVVAIESIIYVQNVRSAVSMGSARGAGLLAAAKAGLSVHEYPATVVKRAVTGKGLAKKEQVGFMMRAMLGLTKNPTSDEADAMAIAVTHLQSKVAQAAGIKRTAHG